jgi:hypothetical protein
LDKPLRFVPSDLVEVLDSQAEAAGRKSLFEGVSADRGFVITSG